MDTFTCSQCGRKYENKNLLKQFRVVKLGKDFCSNSCEKSYERDHVKDFPISANTHSNFNKSGVTQEEVIAKAQVEIEEERLYHERQVLEKENKHELRIENIKSTSEIIDKLNNLDFTIQDSNLDNISKQIEFCLTTSSSTLAEKFDISDSSNNNYEDETERYNQSEKLINTAIMKAELGINKLKFISNTDSGIQYYNLYKNQLIELKIKHVKRNYEILILKQKPKSYIWILCLFAIPTLVYPIFKTINALILLPKKRDKEIYKIKNQL